MSSEKIYLIYVNNMLDICFIYAIILSMINLNNKTNGVRAMTTTLFFLNLEGVNAKTVGSVSKLTADFTFEMFMWFELSAKFNKVADRYFQEES